MSPAVGETLDITANSTIQGLEARISISSEGIEQRVENLETGYSTLINTYADKWNAMVTSGANGNFNSLFEQQASKITTFVRNDEFQSKFEQEAKNITLEANQININGATFDSTGKLTLTAGNLGGWQVASQQLYSGSGAYRVGMQSTPTSGSVSFYAGSETPTNAPFRVTNTGAVYASSFQGVGYVEADKGKIGQWWIYPTDEAYYKKWVVTEYEMTDYDATKRGDIWTTGKWYKNASSQEYYTYIVDLHVPDDTNFQEYPFVFKAGFEQAGSDRSRSQMCAISYLGCVYCGDVYGGVSLSNKHTDSYTPSYGQSLTAMMSNGTMHVTNGYWVENIDVYNNKYAININGHEIVNSLNGTSYAVLHFGTDQYRTITIDGNLVVTGTHSQKSRVIPTKNYGSIALSAYETTTPMFADIGESQIESNGIARIYIDPIFSETVELSDSYQVFVQTYGDGTCYVVERNPVYFEIHGTPGLKFAWEMKAKQIGIDQNRLMKYGMLSNDQAVGNHNFTNEADYINASAIDYGAQGAQYVQEQSA